MTNLLIPRWRSAICHSVPAAAGSFPLRSPRRFVLPTSLADLWSVPRLRGRLFGGRNDRTTSFVGQAVLVAQPDRYPGGIASSRSVFTEAQDRPDPASNQVYDVDLLAARGDARPPCVAPATAGLEVLQAQRAVLISEPADSGHGSRLIQLHIAVVLDVILQPRGNAGAASASRIPSRCGIVVSVFF
jgi:hypothetical protein